jgi:hypothetical protein
MGKWKEGEDAKLIDAVTKYGKDWVAVAALVPDRNNEQCRDRWVYGLNPRIDKEMGKWTAEENAKLIEGVQKHDNSVGSQLPHSFQVEIIRIAVKDGPPIFGS